MSLLLLSRRGNAAVTCHVSEWAGLMRMLRLLSVVVLKPYPAFNAV